MAEVFAVSRKTKRGIATDKSNVDAIRPFAGNGVESDAHFGMIVQHCSRAAQNPDQPNSRQGFDIEPGGGGGRRVRGAIEERMDLQSNSG